MIDALAHLPGQVLSADDFAGRVALVRPEDRVALFAYRPRAGSVDDLEKTVWAVVPGVEGSRAPFEVVESYIYRGPDWPQENGYVVKAGDWLLGVRFSQELWPVFGASRAGRAGRPAGERKERAVGKKASKKFRKAFAVDLSGGTSTAADRQSSGDLTEMVRRSAFGQTRQMHERALAEFDAQVAAAQHRATKAREAGDEFEQARARTELAGALKARLMAKMVIRDNLQANRQIPPGRYGPNSTDLFGGSTLTLGDDRQVHGI